LAYGQGIGGEMKKNKHISIRIDEEVLQKFHYVSKYEDRSASGQIMFLINNCIRDFEEKHGKIELEDEK
jgi:hypothetical protein